MCAAPKDQDQDEEGTAEDGDEEVDATADSDDGKDSGEQGIRPPNPPNSCPGWRELGQRCRWPRPGNGYWRKWCRPQYVCARNRHNNRAECMLPPNKPLYTCALRFFIAARFLRCRARGPVCRWLIGSSSCTCADFSAQVQLLLLGSLRDGSGATSTRCATFAG